MDIVPHIRSKIEEEQRWAFADAKQKFNIYQREIADGLIAYLKAHFPTTMVDLQDIRNCFNRPVTIEVSKPGPYNGVTTKYSYKLFDTPNTVISFTEITEPVYCRKFGLFFMPYIEVQPARPTGIEVTMDGHHVNNDMQVQAHVAKRYPNG